ncbi:hypothetical protein D3C77_464810 [compost metagenome]
MPRIRARSKEIMSPITPKSITVINSMFKHRKVIFMIKDRFKLAFVSATPLSTPFTAWNIAMNG